MTTVKPISLAYPPWQGIVYGAFGMMKSTFASTFDVAGPGVVAMFDAYGKAAPYLRRGTKTVTTVSDEKIHGVGGLPIKRVYNKNELLWEIVFFHDIDPEKPDAYSLFRRWIRYVDPTAWATFVLDSVTSMALASFLEQRYKINPAEGDAYDDKKSLKWRGGMTDQLEMQLMRRLPSFPNNVVVICHVTEDKRQSITKEGLVERTVRMEIDEDMVRGLVAPGRLSKAHGLPSQFAEIYRAYHQGHGAKRKFYLQTQPDEDYLAASQISAIPDPCEPDIQWIWTHTKAT